jgi:hypothetical protein
MAVIKIAGGAEVDVATKSDVIAALQATTDNPTYPVHPNLTSTGAVWMKETKSSLGVVGVPLILKLTRPETGRQRRIMNVAVYGVDDHTVQTGTNVSLYIGDGSILTGATAPLGDLYLPGAQGGSAVTVPANVQFSSGQCLVVWPSELYVQVIGVAATQYGAVAWYWDEPIVDLAAV